MYKNKIPFIHLLHSDIQGFEVEMLEGCKESIKNKKIGYIFISTHSDAIYEKCLKQLRLWKFNIISQHKLSESYSKEGLIAAVSRHFNPSVNAITTSKRRESFLERFIRLIKKWGSLY